MIAFLSVKLKITVMATQEKTKAHDEKQGQRDQQDNRNNDHNRGDTSNRGLCLEQ